MVSSRATLLAAVIGSCWADVVAAWSTEAVDFDSPGLSLLQLRFASTAGAEAVVAGTLAEEASVAGGLEERSDLAEANDEHHAQAQAERALPWQTAHSQAVSQRTLPWATSPLHSTPPERILPWQEGSPQKQEALLDTTKGGEAFVTDAVEISGPIEFSSGCSFTEPAFGVSPGPYNSLTHDVGTLEDCQKLCDVEDSCLAVIFKVSRSVCITLPRKYESNYIKRSRGGVVLNRVCPGLVADAEESSSPVADVEEAGCAFSTAIRGHSPGSTLHEHEAVATLADCQKLCNLDAACLSVVHREGQLLCITLPRAYNDNYEVTSDDAVASNKRCIN